MKYRLFLLAAAFSSCAPRAWALEEGVFFNAATGNYTVRYNTPADADGPAWQVSGVFFPNTKIAPGVTASMERLTQDKFRYRYAVTNAESGEQPLIGVGLPCDSVSVLENVTLVSGWQTITTAGQSEPSNVRWNFTDLSEAPTLATKGLQPGQSQSGFGFDSAYLPGFDFGCFRGNAPLKTYSSQWLDPANPFMAAMAETLDDLGRNNRIAVPLMSPAVAVTLPLDLATVVTNLRAHVAGWPARDFMDEALWARVDDLLSQAESSAKSGNNTGAAAHLLRIRTELRLYYTDLDVAPASDTKRQAAKVLDYDVAYLSQTPSVQPIPTLDPAITDISLPTVAPGTIYSPPLDLDGTFNVTWGTPIPFVQTVCPFPLSLGCYERVIGYELQVANDAGFSNPQTVYSGPNQLFTTASYPPGRYHFRVHARLIHCQDDNWFSGEGGGDYCLESSPETRNGAYYSVGSRVTEVRAVQ